MKFLIVDRAEDKMVVFRFSNLIADDLVDKVVVLVVVVGVDGAVVHLVIAVLGAGHVVVVEGGLYDD